MLEAIFVADWSVCKRFDMANVHHALTSAGGRLGHREFGAFSWWIWISCGRAPGWLKNRTECCVKFNCTERTIYFTCWSGAPGKAGRTVWENRLCHKTHPENLMRNANCTFEGTVWCNNFLSVISHTFFSHFWRKFGQISTFPRPIWLFFSSSIVFVLISGRFFHFVHWAGPASRPNGQ